MQKNIQKSFENKVKGYERSIYWKKKQLENARKKVNDHLHKGGLNFLGLSRTEQKSLLEALYAQLDISKFEEEIVTSEGILVELQAIQREIEETISQPVLPAED